MHFPLEIFHAERSDFRSEICSKFIHDTIFGSTWKHFREKRARQHFQKDPRLGLRAHATNKTKEEKRGKPNRGKGRKGSHVTRYPAGRPPDVGCSERRAQGRKARLALFLCLSLSRARAQSANVPVRGKEIKRRKKGRCLWWCSATTPRAPRRETPRRRPPPPPQRRAPRPSLDDDDDDGETPLCMSVLGRLPAAAASERPKPSPRTSSRRGPSSRKRC